MKVLSISPFVILLLIILILFVLPIPGAASGSNSGYIDIPGKIDPGIYESVSSIGEMDYIVYFVDQADLSLANQLSSKVDKSSFVYEELSRIARIKQAPVISILDTLGVEYRSYWVANMIWVQANEELLEILAARSDVAYVYSNPTVKLQLPQASELEDLPNAVSGLEWNIQLVHAPEVWDLGYTGQNTVIGGQDTGYDWTHPAIQQQYRGWDGQVANHAYNWHDAIHSGGGICGANSPTPCDDNGHGTHTMGTMVGDDGGEHKIGMAPGARWIGCRNMDQGAGTPITYSECYQWFIAPTDLDGNNPDPSLSPHVINNSWSCPQVEGCSDPEILHVVVENVRSAGIVTAHAAGNDGPFCSTIDTPAAIYDASFTVGATNSNDTIVQFSSRGPAIFNEEFYLKPDIVAPGLGVNSSLPGGGYGQKSGTSMATPHVAGLVSLAISADPDLAGNVNKLESVITRTAIPKMGVQVCGTVSPTEIPNNDYGYGRIDALRTIRIITGSSYFFPVFLYSSEGFPLVENS